VSDCPIDGLMRVEVDQSAYFIDLSWRSKPTTTGDHNLPWVEQIDPKLCRVAAGF